MRRKSEDVPIKRKTGVVLVGYGEPIDASSRAVRRFCKSILLDRHCRRGNRFLWWLKVRFGLLRRVARQSVASFQAIWPQGNFPEGQALLALSSQLQQRLADDDSLVVCAATLYGAQSLEKAFSHLKDNNCNRIIIFPLFPQGSFSIDKTLRGHVKDAQLRTHVKARVTYLDSYYNNEMYARALAASIEHAGFNAAAGDRLLVAYSSIPVADIERGDDYELQTGATSLAVAGELGLPRNAWTMAYFDLPYKPGEHLDPKASDVVERWGRFCEGRMFVVCPGYACEGIQTQYYVNRKLRRAFNVCRNEENSGGMHSLVADGDNFVYVSALGKTRAHLKVLSSILAPYLKED